MATPNIHLYQQYITKFLNTAWIISENSKNESNFKYELGMQLQSLLNILNNIEQRYKIALINMTRYGGIDYLQQFKKPTQANSVSGDSIQDNSSIDDYNDNDIDNEYNNENINDNNIGNNTDNGDININSETNINNNDSDSDSFSNGNMIENIQNNIKTITSMKNMSSMENIVNKIERCLPQNTNSSEESSSEESSSEEEDNSSDDNDENNNNDDSSDDNDENNNNDDTSDDNDDTSDDNDDSSEENDDETEEQEVQTESKFENLDNNKSLTSSPSICTAKLKNGTNCSRKTQIGTNYCGIHNRSIKNELNKSSPKSSVSVNNSAKNVDTDTDTDTDSELDSENELTLVRRVYKKKTYLISVDKSEVYDIETRKLVGKFINNKIILDN